MGMGDYIVKVEEARPAGDGKASAGPVFRCIYAKNGLLEVPSSMDSPWDFFRSLGMCQRCGDVKLIACSKCKGSGLIKEGGLFNLLPIVDKNPTFGVKTKSASSSCKICRARGRFSCPVCSNSPQA